jgi:L-ascorbate metabolism protein UlaG (beta-lactamase superfamily)
VKKQPRRRLRRALTVISAALVGLIAAMVSDGWHAFGHRAEGERQARLARSPQWAGDHCENPQPLVNSWTGMVTGLFDVSPDATPSAPLPLVSGDAARFAVPPPSGLRVTWLGHSTTLVEIDGARVLTDPVWSMRVSPFGWVGPQRWYAPPVALAELPAIDAVVISHDHYDHLDRPTILAMKSWSTRFFVPLGVGAHLAYWGIPEERIVELDWWERARVGTIEISAVPARHATGRSVFDDGSKLWAGWALLGGAHRVYYSGDTGLFPAMREIGERLGPFDLTMIEVGQYGNAWPDWHVGPEQAVEAHQMVKGRLLLPVHWGAITLAYHGWTEPIERVIVAASAAGVSIVAPRPGESFEPSAPPAVAPWWPALPWKTAAEDPIVSTQMDR